MHFSTNLAVKLKQDSEYTVSVHNRLVYQCMVLYGWSAAMSLCHREMSNAVLIFGYGASIMWLLIRKAFVFSF